MEPLINFATSVPKAGHVWVPAEEWNILNGRRQRFARQDRPKWRFRPPWNKPDSPRELLRRVDPEWIDTAWQEDAVILSDASGKELHRIRSADDVKSEVLRKIKSQTDRFISPTREDSALFRNFAQLKPAKESIAQFADRNGLLYATEVGVPFTEWEYEIQMMRFLVEIWDAIVDKRAALLASRFPKVRGRFRYPHVEQVCHYNDYRTGRWTADPELITPSSSGTLLETAREYVVRAVNLRIGRPGVQPELTSPHRNGSYADGLVLRFEAYDLLSAMWCQFAASIAAQTQYRQCESCGRYMELSPDVNRADRRYCSDACRNRALRRRQKLARQMRDAGKTPRQISKAMGSDLDTIKQWLQNRKKVK